jgi:hypothetical protein
VGAASGTVGELPRGEEEPACGVLSRNPRWLAEVAAAGAAALAAAFCRDAVGSPSLAAGWPLYCDAQIVTHQKHK